MAFNNNNTTSAAVPHKPTIGEKISGTVDSLVGKATHNPAKVAEGEAKKTGAPLHGAHAGASEAIHGNSGASALGNNHGTGLTGNNNHGTGLTGNNNHGTGLTGNNNHGTGLTGNNHSSGLTGNNHSSGLTGNNHSSGLTGSSHTGTGLTGSSHNNHSLTDNHNTSHTGTGLTGSHSHSTAPISTGNHGTGLTGSHDHTHGHAGTHGTGLGHDSHANKPSVGEKISGGLESMVGKATSNPAKVHEGEAKKTHDLQHAQAAAANVGTDTYGNHQTGPMAGNQTHHHNTTGGGLDGNPNTRI